MAVASQTFEPLSSPNPSTDFLRPFIQCTTDVFRRMLQWDIEFEGAADESEPRQRHECSGVIGISGAVRGTIIISVSSNLAIQATSTFIGECPEGIDTNVIDTVGELTNMIAGSSKDRLGIAGINLGLPTVVIGQQFSFAFDHNARTDLLKFRTPHGPLVIEIALKGRPSGI